MRKIVLFIAALLFMAVPAMGVPNVAINCVPGTGSDSNLVTVSYAVTGSTHLVRAFALDINTSGDVNITDVCALNANYRIYPGQISIVNGNVSAYGTPYELSDLGDANVTIEMGSLYTTDANYASDSNAGYNKKPGLSGDLLKFRVKAECNYNVTQNAIRGGIVMEDPCEEPNVTLCSGHAGGIVGCTVPNVVGGSRTAANTAITNANLVPNGTGVLSCVTLNQVLAQSPAGGTQVTCSSTVDYNYSLYQTTVPSVVGGTKSAADTAITNAGLVPNGTGVLSCQPLNQVLTQNPAGSTVVACASTVDYNYSLYQTTEPNVVGMTEANAITAITNAGLVVGTKTYGNGGAIPIGQVYSQSPAPGTRTCGTAVNINVSSECLDQAATTTTHWNDWVAWGKPKCWCYSRQCRGDINGKKTLGFYVQSADIAIFRSALGQSDANLALIPNGICADLNQKKTLGFRVQSADVTIIRTYLGQPDVNVPVCPTNWDGADGNDFRWWATP